MRRDHLEHYLRELSHIRAMAEEFAAEHPKIAGRLRLGDREVRDPLVERLLEGFAFVASRIQSQLDAEFPRFTQHLLEMAYPGYLAPLPACGVVRLTPRPDAPALNAGVTIPRGTSLTAMAPRVWRTVTTDERAPCEFRSVQEVTLWPLRIVSASAFGRASDLPLAERSGERRSRGGLRLVLETTNGVALSALPIDVLVLHFEGTDPQIGAALYDAVIGSDAGVVVVAGSPAAIVDRLPAESVEPVGFDDREAVLPVTPGSSGGLRLLQEYFTYRPRFRFVRITGLRRLLSRVDARRFELVLPFEDVSPTLEGQVDASCVSLYATPIVNLFACDTDLFSASPHRFEHHVVVNRSRPYDYEVHSVESLEGIEHDTGRAQRFVPYFGTEAAWGRVGSEPLNYFTVRRDPFGDARESPGRAGNRSPGARSDYEGQEVYVALVGPGARPYEGATRELRARVLATNRDLPLLLPRGSINSIGLAHGAPVKELVLASPMTRPGPRAVDGETAWRLVAMLQPNYLSLLWDPDAPQSGAAALRGLLALHLAPKDEDGRRIVDAVRGLRATPVFRRLPHPGPIVFGRGLEIELTIDDDAFAGGGRQAFGTVMQRFLSRFVSINSFVQLAMRSESHHSALTWTRTPGSRPIA